MVISLKLKNIPLYLKIIIMTVPSLIFVMLFIVFIFLPKNKEINTLRESIINLDNDIASSEIKAKKLDLLKIENERLKIRLAELQEQLPEEKEVSPLLKQISDMGLKSGLEILLWRPGERKQGANNLYIEIPVQMIVVGGYHDLGVFFSKISNIKRIVNITNLKIDSYETKSGSKIKADFIASTFSVITEAEKVQAEQQQVKK